MKMLGSKADSDRMAAAGMERATPERPAAEPAPAAEPGAPPEPDIRDDDIPF